MTATDPAGPARSLPPIGGLPGRISRGQMIGRFIVIDQLGAGAGGVVVSAYDPDLDRKVALKVLRPEHVFSGSVGRARERLLREAKAVARVNHPNIVTVHEVGSVGDQVFVAMEYIDGGTLRDTLSLRRRSWRGALDLLLPAARGLAAAHAEGLVHRDFKPANVLVSRTNRVVVSDFGLVSTNDDDEQILEVEGEPARPRDPSLTDTGTTLGTPAYMAPEQHRGADVDARSDQFAFCVTLFEALYGVRPFAGNTLLALMKAKERGEIAKPLASDLPSWLQKLVLRGLSADPEERFATMADLIGDIESHLQHLQNRSSRNWIGLASLVLIGPAAIIGYRALTANPETQAPDSEVLALRAQLANRDGELSRLREELREERSGPSIDPEVVAPLEARIAELEGERLATKNRPRRPSDTISRKAKSTAPSAGEGSQGNSKTTFELATRVRRGPPLPDVPEPPIVASVFNGLRPAIEQCANIPDMNVERDFKEWERLMERPIDAKISVTLRIEPHGLAKKVRVQAQSSGVRTCVALVVRRARFPISTQGGDASYRYSLID